MTLKNLLPYVRWTIRTAQTGDDLRAIASMLEYWIPSNIPSKEAFDLLKQELLEEFDTLLAKQDVIYTK